MSRDEVGVVANLRNRASVTKRRWRRIVASVRTEPEGPRFVVFAQGRTGSTLLQQLLDSHPRVVCDGEIFAPRRFGRIRDVERHLMGSINLSAVAGDHYGFKLKPYELTHHGVDPGHFLERRAAEGWGVIHLTRANVIRHALSSEMRELRGRAHVRKGSSDAAAEGARRYRLDPASVIDNARSRREFLSEELRALDAIEYYTVEYERDLSEANSHQRTADAIFHWLGLPPSPVTTRLARLNPDDLTTKVANFDELLAAVNATEFAGMLDPLVS